MSKEFYRALAQDFQSLGFPLEPESSEPKSYANIYNLATATAYISDVTIERSLGVSATELTTAFGAALHTVVIQGQVRHPEKSSNTACHVTEARLVKSSNFYGNRLVAPIIIVDDAKRPVLVQKNYGEPTCYCLDENSELGLVAGAIYEQPDVKKSNSHGLPLSEHAWVMPIGSYGLLRYMRLSTLLIPPTEKTDLKTALPTQEIAVRASHEQLQATIAGLLPYAQPVPV